MNSVLHQVQRRDPSALVADLEVVTASEAVVETRVRRQETRSRIGLRVVSYPCSGDSRSGGSRIRLASSMRSSISRSLLPSLAKVMRSIPIPLPPNGLHQQEGCEGQDSWTRRGLLPAQDNCPCDLSQSQGAGREVRGYRNPHQIDSVRMNLGGHKRV